jgi:DNA-binding MarR family transcriptional regulator
VESSRSAEPRIQLEATFEETWPGASALATACILNLHVLAEQIGAYGEAVLQKYGIPSRAAFNVLTILAGDPDPLLPSIIAERMVVTRPTVTGVLHTLEGRGLIRRRPHPTDGRMALVEITDAGRACVEQIRPALHRAERRWLAALDEAEQRTLLDCVAKLQANTPPIE